MIPRSETGTGRTVLLVDDEKAFADALAFRLESRDIPCLIAYRGDDALAFLDRRELEVVLLDLNMPGLHGLEVLRLIKTKRPDLEVVLLTGESDLAVAARGMRRGAGDYLVKPVDFTVLLESIAKARERSREHKERLRAAETGRLMALGALAAGVGHEINNPLQIILQRSEWLHELLEDAEKGGPDIAEMKKSAGIIQEQARRAGGITAQLLDLALRSRSGNAETDVAELAARVVQLHAARAGTLGVRLLTAIDEGLPVVPCSPMELEPVFIHLFRNALDAIEAKGQPGASDTVTLSAKLGRGALLISVADTGEGIAPEYAGQIFDPFFSLRPVGKGAGLGLTVCHSIITALRGSLSFAPGTPCGAVFSMEIPVDRDAEAPGQE